MNAAEDAIVIRQSVLVVVAHRRELIGRMIGLGPHGGFFVEGYTEIGVGSEVDLELIVLEESLVFHVRGMVRWRRPTGTAKAPAGIGLEFLEYERQTADALREFSSARGSRALQPRARRFPAMIEVEFAHDSQWSRGVTDNINRGGAFIITPHPARIGTILTLHLKSPRGADLVQLRGQAVWHKQTEVRAGMGVRFLFDSADQRHALDRLIENITEKLPTFKRFASPFR